MKGNWIIIEEFAGSLLVIAKVIIILPVILTVVGLKVTYELSKVAGVKLTAENESLSEWSLPIAPKNEEVVIAGNGFSRLDICKSTCEIYNDVGIAFDIVIILFEGLAEQVYELGEPFIRT